MSERSLSELVAARLAIADKWKAWRMAKKETLARDWLHGAETENARLSSTHELLVKCVEALGMVDAVGMSQPYDKIVRDALTELRKLCEEK